MDDYDSSKFNSKNEQEVSELTDKIKFTISTMSKKSLFKTKEPKYNECISLLSKQVLLLINMYQQYYGKSKELSKIIYSKDKLLLQASENNKKCKAIFDKFNEITKGLTKQRDDTFAREKYLLSEFKRISKLSEVDEAAAINELKNINSQIEKSEANSKYKAISTK